MSAEKVMFRIFQGELLALFPALAGTNQPHTCTCYAHVGQHGSADLGGCIAGSKPATPAQYRPLARELRRIGYKLRIVKRSSLADYRERLAQTR